LNDTHGLLKAIAWIRNGLQIGVCDNGKRGGQVGKGAALDNWQTGEEKEEMSHK
jgi:hypothetical protein